MGKRKKLKQERSVWPQVSRPLSYMLLAAVLLFFGLIRVRLLTFPLERDEGEYAYAGSLMLHGIVPYRLCYTMKLPGAAAGYAIFEAILGHTATSIHLGLLVVNSATIVLIFLLAKRLWGPLAALVASASFALLSLEPGVLGFAGHATQLVVLPAVAGALVLLKGEESQKLSLFFGGGVLLGCAFLMKQPGFFFILWGIFWVVWSAWKRGLQPRTWAFQLGMFSFGSVLPLLATCLIMLYAGVFKKFWFLVFSYAREYGTETSLSMGWENFWLRGGKVVGDAPLMWMMGISGLVLLYRDSKTRPDFGFAVSFLLFSFLAVCPGLYFREHYFVVLLPAVSLLCGACVTAGSNLLLKSKHGQQWGGLPALLFVICLLSSIFQSREYLFTEKPLTLCRRLYADNPFPEALEISDYINRHSRSDDRVAVIGSEPEIYFYADRLSATGYIYMYPLMELQPFASTMQREMISEIEKAQPRFLVFANAPLSWLRQEGSDETILEWPWKYIRDNHYELVGVADMADGGTEYRWAPQAATYRPHSSSQILVFDREAAPKSPFIPGNNHGP